MIAVGGEKENVEEAKQGEENIFLLPAFRKEANVMWNRPGPDDLAKIPAFYSTDKTPFEDKVIHMHFFIGGCDWYVVEYDSENKMFFGFAILNNDYEMAEWGYFSLEELSGLKVSFLEVDRDLYFTPKKAIEIEKIRKAEGWPKKGEGEKCGAS